MGWVSDLDDQVVGLDTAPLIYYIEENPKYLATIDPFFEALEEGRFSIVTSTITLLEALIHPLRKGDQGLAEQYQQILTQDRRLTLVSMTISVAQKAAQLRASYNIHTPDAIQIATAIDRGASFFLTNDVKLKKVSEIQVLILDELL